MGDFHQDLAEASSEGQGIQEEKGANHHVWLTKDNKTICWTQCLDSPAFVPSHWVVLREIRRRNLQFLNDLPQFYLYPATKKHFYLREWGRFLHYLQERDLVAISKSDFCDFYILPPNKSSSDSYVKVKYQMVKGYELTDGQKPIESAMPHKRVMKVEPMFGARDECNEDTYSCSHKIPVAAESTCVPKSSIQPFSTLKPLCLNQDKQEEQKKNFIRVDPSYLETLGHAHSGWIFGAIAELIDNSRDAKATKLEIFIENVYLNKTGKTIPMLSIVDDGHGMSHEEVVRMTTFGHKQPHIRDVDRIGRFGVGFKTGAMRLGRDALVLTQTENSRSIAFLSQSLNEGKDNLEIPIVSYIRKGQLMEVDTNFLSKALAKNNLKAIKEFSPFNKYLIGEKAGLFQGRHTGTQIYIWNLDQWGSSYSLEWHTGLDGGSSFQQGDILVRSRRVRSRPGQLSRKVPMDYSLRSYLEVIFLVPRIKIYIQGSLVKSRPLAKSLNNTVTETGSIMGKHVELTIGRSQLEWEQANCGIFLYWHGRLIEAYKRVGGMVHNGDVGRGVIGVIDVTDIMYDGDRRVWVHNNKQGFQDCEAYVQLEEWLASRTDEYLDRNVDTLKLKKGNSLYKPDQEWVQCDKCRKWRMLTTGYDIKNLPLEWFCYMEPFSGACEMAEQKVQPGVITISSKRFGYDCQERPVQVETVDISARSPEGNNDHDTDQRLEKSNRVLKRIRRGPHRACRNI